MKSTKRSSLIRISIGGRSANSFTYIAVGILAGNESVEMGYGKPFRNRNE